MNNDPFALEGRIAVITGGGTGVGAATTRLFAARGADVAIASRTRAELEAVASDVERATGRRVEVVPTDVRDEEAVATLIDRTVERFGRLDILINNAGGSRPGDLFDVPVRAFDAVVSLNLRAAFLCAQAAAPHLAASGNGAIVNISSAAGVRGVRRFGPYSAAKAGLQMLTSVTAAEWGPSGVRANCIALGLIASPRAQAAWAAAELDTEALLGSTPLRRTGTPEEVANVILFLASDASSYVTGQTFSVDGGPLIAG